jgi:hypothetical protein
MIGKCSKGIWGLNKKMMPKQPCMYPVSYSRICLDQSCHVCNDKLAFFRNNHLTLNDML